MNPHTESVIEPPGPILVHLAESFADEVVGRYRIERSDALAVILGTWTRRPALVAAAARAGSADEVRRLRVYRDAATEAKRDVYQRLRRYHPAGGDAGALEALCALPPDAPAATRAE